MNTKLLIFRIAVISFLVLNFIISFKMETESECLIMLFTFMFGISYLAAEVVNAFDEAEPKS